MLAALRAGGGPQAPGFRPDARVPQRPAPLPLSKIIVDFFAPAARLVVEVDGAHHTRQRGADKRRDAAFVTAGLSVLRLRAQSVLGQLPLALQLVRSALSA